MGQEGGAPTAVPADTAAAALPEGPTQSTRRWTSVVERHLTGPAYRHGCPLLDVAMGGGFDRVSHVALDRSKAIAPSPPVKGQPARPPLEPPPPATPAEPAESCLNVLTCAEAAVAVLGAAHSADPLRCGSADVLTCAQPICTLDRSKVPGRCRASSGHQPSTSPRERGNDA
jgi:hypothetical protein